MDLEHNYLLNPSRETHKLHHFALIKLVAGNPQDNVSLTEDENRLIYSDSGPHFYTTAAAEERNLGPPFPTTRARQPSQPLSQGSFIVWGTAADT